MIAALSALPADQVALIAAFGRQARRDALKEAADTKRQRKRDDRANGNYDEADFTRRNLAVIASQGKRAGRGSLAALAALSRARRHIETWIDWGISGCRAEGYSDEVIGTALGYQKPYAQQEVHREVRQAGTRRRAVGQTPTPKRQPDERPGANYGGLAGTGKRPGRPVGGQAQFG